MDDSAGTRIRTNRRRRPVRLLLLAPILMAAGGLSAACQPNPNQCDGIQATIVGTDGNDLLEGTNGPDVIVGKAGRDTIRGFDGNDTLCGGPDFDTIEGGNDADTIDGGSGTDECRQDSGNGPVRNCEASSRGR